MVVLEALSAAAAYSLAMGLRFWEEGAIPETYLARLLPWAILAGAIHVGSGQLTVRLRRPGAPLAQHPVLPFAVSGAAALTATLVVNFLILPTPLRLPLSVAVVGPLLAAAASAALRLAAVRPPVQPEDLLRRRSVELDVEACSGAIRGRDVWITGAAGSIGSELARQVLAVGPRSLTLLDVNETGLYDLEAELLQRAAGCPTRVVMADVAVQRQTRDLFLRDRPHVVFHAAAYKHVPLVELNPDQGFTTNVVGTMAVCEAAVEAGVERVVVISTDKAVNPSSFMGVTKRVAELIVTAVGGSATGTTITAVRFGNVLGSRGSLVPTLLRQIDAGGPVTITDRQAQRYFMTLAEAASLVLRSAAFAAAGTIFVLDMGEEIKIVDLAERLVRLKGLTPGRDVRFVYTGLRPGEKLREELAGPDERLLPTDHPYVRRVESNYAVDARAVLEGIRDVNQRRAAGELAASGLPAALRAVIEDAVREPRLASAS